MRKGRGLALTAQGRMGSTKLAPGFDLIRDAVADMRSRDLRQRLIVSVEPSFATAWLVPRLERFRKKNAAIDVLIDSSLKIVDLERDAADVAVRFGLQPDDSLASYRLFDEQLCAFCSPALTSGDRGLNQLDQLEQATLLHWDLSDLDWASSTRRWMGWQPWLAEVGAGHINPDRGIRFSDYNLAVQAAIAGQGVVLGSLPVLQDLVASNLLVCPFPERVTTDIGYDLVTTEASLAATGSAGILAMDRGRNGGCRTLTLGTTSFRLVTRRRHTFATQYTTTFTQGIYPGKVDGKS